MSNVSTKNEKIYKEEGYNMTMSTYDDIKVLEENADKVVFEMTNTTPAIANKLRVTLLEMVPTMAIDRVEVVTNTTVMHNEALTARLGLIPIVADARKFEYYDEHLDANNSICFMIDIECDQDMTVTTSDMHWIPLDGQEKKFPEGFSPFHDDIPIIKMKAGQALKIQMHCVKGTAEKHTKWSPVGTATFRLISKGHYVFTSESVGQYGQMDLLHEAIRIASK